MATVRKLPLAAGLAVLLSGGASATRAQSASSLAIPEAALHQFEDGPALPGSYVFLPGDPLFLSARFSGYKKTDTDPARILLRWQVEAFDSAGVPLVQAKSEKIDVELAPQDKEWRPKIRHDFMIPPLADSGEYKIVITLSDELAKTSTRRELTFRVKGQDVAPSDTLVIRNFRFLRDERDGPGIDPPAYRPGDAVWARFAITGYRLSEKNRFHVAYGVEVLRASGASLYSAPEAANEQEETFYRKRYVQGTFSLQLTPDLSKGEYTLVVRVRDLLGGQEHESQRVFTVE